MTGTPEIAALGLGQAGSQLEARQALQGQGFAEALAQVQAGRDAGAASESQLKSATDAFETFLIKRLLEVMRQSLPKDDLLGQSYAHGVYQDMFDGELAKRMTAAGGIGLGALLREQLSRRLDGARPDAQTKGLDVSG